MTFARIRHRLTHGRPLVLDSDTCASFRARGVALDTPGAVGLLLRERQHQVARHYHAEIERGVDVLCALTADTTPRALAEVGMEHRSAALTGTAVELALEAASMAPKPVAVAGVLGSDMVGPAAAERLHAELGEHARRLAAAGCELLLVRGQGSRIGLMAGVVAAAATELPVWASIEVLPSGELAAGGAAAPLLESLGDAGASVVLFEVPGTDVGVSRLRSVADTGLALGVLLAGGPESVRGFPDSDAETLPWAARALELDASGARVIGGGAGTTEEHTAALAQALGAAHPSLPPSA